MLTPSTPFLLDWLPGETAYSLVSRLHRLWGHPLPSTTAQILFGHVRGGYQHDLPTHLRAFAKSTEGLLGKAEEIARTRTLYRYYQAFLPEEARQHLVSAMSGASLAHAKLRLGILTSRFRANHPLKACKQCMQEDAERHQTSYWHLEHQFPGVWTCPEHGTLLQEAVVKANGVRRFGWFLPNDAGFRAWPPEDLHRFEEERSRLARLGQTILSTVRSGELQYFEPDRLLASYRMVLAEHGWLSPGGNLRLDEIAESFFAYSRSFSWIPELIDLPRTHEEAHRKMGRLLRPLRGGTHPLRHLLLIDWLFNQPGAFLERYAQTSLPPTARSPLCDERGGVDASERPLIRLQNLLQEEQLSMREAAKRLGIDISTAMAWAAECGIASKRRPKWIKDPLRREVIRDLKGGAEKTAAAERCGCSVQTITRLLFTEPGLHSEWMQARQTARRNGCRQAWLALLDQYGTLGTKYLRSLDPAAYAWLYRNDRGWLDQHPVPRREPPEVVRVNWDERDHALSTEVAKTALELAQTTPGKPIHLWQLYQRIPELRAKLGALDRLPLTQAAIDLAITRRKGR